ncbi:MAG: hypothetical protein RL398_1693, partial [Planctomycetota bacterium]
PEAVRRNLGITFHTVQRRLVSAQLRVPGRFELLPEGRRDHRMPLDGKVELQVAPLGTVRAGDLLFSIDSPAWRRTQHELAELRASLEVGETRLRSLEPLLAAHEQHERSLNEACKVLADRIDELTRVRAEVGGQAAELAATRVQLAQMRAEVTEAAEKHTEAMALRAELSARGVADRERFRLLLATAQGQLGLTVDDLLATGSDGRARWQSLDVVEVRAKGDGIVQTIVAGNGAWLDAGAPVLEIVDPRRLRFVGSALQSDLAKLDAAMQLGWPVAVVAPSDGNADAPPLPPAIGALRLGAMGDAEQRTLPIAIDLEDVPAWARHGMAAVAGIQTAVSKPQLAIPVATLQQSGLQKVFFLRNPKDPDEVLRIEADLGTSDGRWVEVKSGLVEGDEVVLGGGYALMLASGPQQKAGHFHADGTFHADEDHE